MALGDDVKLIAEAAVLTAYHDPDPNLKQSGPIKAYVKSGVSYHRPTAVFEISRPVGDVQAHTKEDAARVLAQAWMEELDQLRQSDPSRYSRATSSIEGPYVFLARSVLSR